MTRRKSHRQADHDRDLAADTASGDGRDRQADSLRLGDVLLRQGEARSADVEQRRVRPNAGARGEEGRKSGPSKGKIGR